MKTIAQYSSGIEAKFASDYLNSQGLTSQVRGAKDYLALYMGGDKGNFDVLVAEADVEKAQTQLQSLDLTRDTSLIEVSAKTYLKRAIMFSFLAAFVLPLVFNISAINSLISYVKVERNVLRKTFAIVVVTILQAISVFFVYFFFKPNHFSH